MKLKYFRAIKMEKKLDSRLFFWLQIGVVTLFLGRAWQYLYWDAPYRVLLWDENWMRPIIESIFNLSWESYVTNLKIDQGIQNFIRATGILFLIAAFAAIFIKKWKKVAFVMLWMGAINLAFLAFLLSKDRFFQIPQFFEYSLQWSAPVFLIFFYKKESLTLRLFLWMKIATALTFICHGIYAIGLGNVQRAFEFTQMTISILHTDESGAILFLKIVGILDLLVGLLLFLPGKISLIAAGYLTFWGGVTTAARIYAHFSPEQFSVLLFQFVHEALYRCVHFIVPAMLFMKMRNNVQQELKENQKINNPSMT